MWSYDRPLLLWRFRIGLVWFSCPASYAFTQGDYNTTIAKLMPIKNTTAQFGGSHAQRDIIARALLEAAIRASNKKLDQILSIQ
jgi:hypothetical protein